MSEKPTRWGILSAGDICFDFVNSIAALPEDLRVQHEVVAIAARSLKKAEEFAKKFDIPTAYEGYDKLAADPDVDVIYVGTINPVHLENVKMLVAAGKNILCEKPLGMNVKETKEMIKLAQEKKVIRISYFLFYFSAMLF